MCGCHREGLYRDTKVPVPTRQVAVGVYDYSPPSKPGSFWLPQTNSLRRTSVIGYWFSDHLGILSHHCLPWVDSGRRRMRCFLLVYMLLCSRASSPSILKFLWLLRPLIIIRLLNFLPASYCHQNSFDQLLVCIDAQCSTFLLVAEGKWAW